MMDKDKGKKASPEKAEPPKTADDTAEGSKRKRRSEVEPRTPIKRQRVPVQKFQSPADELTPIPSTSKQKDAPELLHKKGSFLGVRGEEGSFYLCKTIQNVFNNTKKFRIQWLDLVEKPDVYKLDFVDNTDADCILTNVKMEKVVKDKYRLPMKEQKRVEEILLKALKKERGEPVDDIVINMSGSDDDVEVAEEEEEDSDDDEWEDPPPKKSKSKSRKSSTGKSPKQVKQTKPAAAKGKKEVVKIKQERKKGPDRNLHPNPKIKIMEKDPFFETKEKMDFVSKIVQGKLAIRAVQLGDMKMLNSLIEDKEHVHLLTRMRSVDVQKNALHYALERNNHEAIKILVKDYFEKNERVEKGSPPAVLLGQLTTGGYNPRSLGFRRTRQVALSRGSKEGNNAFVKDVNDDYAAYRAKYVEDAMELNITKETLQVLINTGVKEEDKATLMQTAKDNIYQAVLCGNRKLAGYLVEEALKDPFTGFGYLHKDVLVNDKEGLRATILAASVKKKMWDNKSITPLHCAAINPNVSYLTRLLSVEPNINIEDRDHRRVIHFAAVCDGTGPLEYLLQRGASPLEQDNKGMTPLHYACSAGRPRNVDILLKKAKEASEKQGDVFDSKWGPGGVDKPNRSSFCPIHIAVSYSHADVLKILIKHQVDVNKILSAGKNKITPLMIAASHGNLEICKVLIQHGAHVEQLDKLKRSALIHAVMNGNANVASFLLNLGADPDRCDSSGNSVTHYAAGYGWLHCLKLLKEAGANLGLANQWASTPISIGFLKGHLGIVDFLLKQANVNINFRDDEGMTLTSVAVNSALEPGLVEQLKYLLNKKADPSIKDANGFDSLHHLAVNPVVKYDNKIGCEALNEELMDLTVKIAKMFLDAGCDPTVETDDGKTALMFAIEQMNFKLVELLVGNGATVTTKKFNDEKTILHLMADVCMKTDVTPILKVLLEQKPTVKKDKGKESVKETKGNNDKKLVLENGDDGDDSEKSDAMEIDEGDDAADDIQQKKDGTEGKSKQNGAANMNGMEVEKSAAPPPLEKSMSVPSQQDIWPMMAAEVDNKGYTPLLTACKVYRDYKKHNKVTDEEMKKCSQNARSFIAALIDLVGSDVSAVVQEKEGDKVIGQLSALHMLVKVGHEVLEGMSCAGLELLCRYKPNTEYKNSWGKTPLVMAVEDQSKKALKLLIAAGANVNVSFGSTAEGFHTPLHKATADCKVEIVKTLIQAKADVKAENTKSGDQPINIAVHLRFDDSVIIEVVRLLLDAGADVNTGKRSALHSAVLANTGKSDSSTDLEEYLISRGSNVFARDEMKRLPLHYAFISQANPSSTSAVDPIDLCSVLTDAMGNKELEAVDENGLTPLHMAATRGATICCIHLLQRGVNIMPKDSCGKTPLYYAVKNKHDSCAIALLQKGAKVDDTMITVHSQAKDWRRYHELEGGVKLPVWEWFPTRITEEEAGLKEQTFSVYEGAIDGELQGVAHMVLDSTGLNGKAIAAALRVQKYHIALRHLNHIKDKSLVAGYKNKDEQNLLHILAKETKPGSNTQLQLKVAKALVEKGVSMKAQDKFKRCPIVYIALNHQSVDLAKYYLEKGRGSVDLNQKDVYDRTAIVALFWDQQEMFENSTKDKLDYLKLFVEEGASLDVQYNFNWPDFPLFDITMSHVLLDYCVSVTTNGKITPLLTAMYNDDRDVVRYLLKSGANVNLTDEKGMTPLMHAVKMNDVEFVKLLLNYDHTMKTTDDSNEPPKLKKKLSRRAFACFAPTTEDDPVDDNDGDDDDGDDDDNEDEDFNEDDEFNDEDDEGMDEDMNSDHDTDDVMDIDEEEEEEAVGPLPIPRLGSKQPSLRKQPTSLLSLEESYDCVEKTSKVNLAAKDNKSWSVIHHLVSPMTVGTFDNVEIFYVLNKVGTPLTIENNTGETPLKLALKVGAMKLAAKLQEKLGVEVDKREKPTFTPFSTEVPVAPSKAYKEDADNMVKKLQPSDKQAEKPNKPKVDDKCMAASTGEVMYDPEQKIPYDVILSKVDIHNTMLYDTFNFYKMQVIYHKAKGIYILFTKWGRIGDEGQYQQTPYQKLDEAVVSFCKIFKSKTGNTWANVKKFTNQPKKYRLVETENQPQEVLRVDFNMESSIPSKLPKLLQSLIKEMANVSMLEEAMSHAKMSEEYMPFGRIKRNTLIEARKILQTVGDIVVDMEKKKQNPTYDNTEHQNNCDKISKLSTEYYSLIPVEGYTYDRVEPLSSRSHITTHMRLISNLLDLETASKILLGAQYRLKEMNPLDYIYRELGCGITPLREDDVDSQYILRYIKNSARRADVLCVFKLCRPGEDQREKFKSLDNHQLLWHGTNMSNIIGILKNGLLVAPAEAPITGHVFGEGIYTADTFVKSKGYCDNYNPKSNIKCALLCEVALGNCQENIITDDNVDLLHSEYNSLKILGQEVPDYAFNVAMPFGTGMSMGCLQKKMKWKSPEGEKPRWVKYDEYIVQDSDQVALRYIVMFA